MNSYLLKFHEIFIFSVLKNLDDFFKKWASWGSPSNVDNTFGQPTLHIVWNETQSGRMCSFISECPEKSKNLKYSSIFKSNSEKSKTIDNTSK